MEKRSAMENSRELLTQRRFYLFLYIYFFSYSDAVGRSDLLCPSPLPLLFFPLPLVLIPEVVIYSLLLAEGEKKKSVLSFGIRD